MIRVGSRVKWNWGNGEAKGKVSKIYNEDIELDINGTSVKIKASTSKPAYLIVQDDNEEVLKSSSEVSKC